MGEGLLCFYKKTKTEYRIAFVSTFFITILIHLYKFTNTLPNHDSLYNYYSDQNVLGSGRWALSLACGISSYWDLPWIIGLLCCVFIALTVVVITALFQLKNPVLIGLTGAFLAASPSTTETFFFLYTADGYMIAMFLAALAVYLSRINEPRKSKFLLSGLCICVCCGIYQAYVSFALLLAVCYFIYVLLQNTYSKQDCCKWILRQVIIYSLSLATYYFIWKLFLHFTETVANDYQGISEVGKINADLFVSGLLNSVKSSLLYFLQWDVLANGFTMYSVLNILFLLVMAAGLLIGCYKSKVWERKWAVVLLVLCLVAIMPFACIWHFTSEHVGYRAMMLQSLTLLFVLTAILYEQWAMPAVKNAVCLLLLVIVFNNTLMANISYFYMNLCYERTYAEGIEMMSEIHDLQDIYTFDKIAVVGTRSYDVQYESIDPDTGRMQPTGSIHMLSGLLEKSLLYDSEHTIRFLQTTFGLDLTPLSQTQADALLETTAVQNMDCWPSGNSIAVMDDTLVLKLSDRKAHP